MPCQEAGRGAFHGGFSPYGCHLMYVVSCRCELFVDGGVVIVEFLEQVGVMRTCKERH